MAVTIDKFLGRPLNHKHSTTDIVGYSAPVASSSITVTGNVTAGTEDIILVNALSNAITISLPQASTVANKIYKIKKTDSSVNAVTVRGYGSELIDGDSSLIISFQNSAVQMVSNSSGWYIV